MPDVSDGRFSVRTDGVQNSLLSALSPFPSRPFDIVSQTEVGRPTDTQSSISIVLIDIAVAALVLYVSCEVIRRGFFVQRSLRRI